jgi:hypothetical protein
VPVWNALEKKKSPMQESIYALLFNQCGINGCLKLNTELGVAISVLALDHFLMLTNLP